MNQIYNSKFNTQDIYLLSLHLILVLFVLTLNFKFNNSIETNNTSLYGFSEIYDPVILKLFISKFGIFFPNFINSVFLPLCSFFIFILIFYKFLPIIWAISISLLSIMQSNNAPLRDFILLKINTSETMASIAITNFPTPSLSIFLFLLFIYITLNINISKSTSLKNNLFKNTFIFILWSLLIHIQPLDGVLGFLFAFIYLNISLYKLYNIKSLNILYISGIALIIITNSLIIFLNIDLNNISYSANQNDITFYFILFYLFFPIFLLIILFFLQKIDLTEILFKFLNIFTLIIIELFFILIFKMYGHNFFSHITMNRSTVFFLHFFYYVPFVYYLTRPLTNLDNNQIYLYIFVKKNINNISFICLNFFSFLIYFNTIYIIF